MQRGVPALHQPRPPAPWAAELAHGGLSLPTQATLSKSAALQRSTRQLHEAVCVSVSSLSGEHRHHARGSPHEPCWRPC